MDSFYLIINLFFKKKETPIMIAAKIKGKIENNFE